MNNMKLSIPDYILSITAYPPGKPVEELQRETGIKRTVKLASNENPLGPSPLAVKAIRASVGRIHRYPDSGGYDLVKRLSTRFQVDPQCIVLGNGSDDMISMLTRAFLQKGDEAIAGTPSFLMYDIMIRYAAATPIPVPLTSLAIDLQKIRDNITSRTRMVFLCNPNNPTGSVFLKGDFETFLKQVPPEVVVVVDEAYFEFVRDPDCASGIEYLNEEQPLVTLRTFSKAYGLAGLRIGYGVMPKQMAAVLNRIRQPFNANSLAQAGAMAALDDVVFLKKTRALIHEGLDFLYASLQRMGIEYYPTQANFFLIDVKRDADEVFEIMLRHGVIVRSMKSYGYPECIRINVGLEKENTRFIKVLEKIV